MTNNRFRLEFWQQWSDIIWNHRMMIWVDIDLIGIQIGNAQYKQTFELNLALLGFCIGLEWYYGGHR